MKQDEFLKHINKHKGILIKISKMYVDSIEDQRDLQQEMVYQLWKSIASYEGNSKFSTWVYRVALNTAITSFKYENKRIDKEPFPSFQQPKSEAYDDTKDKQLVTFYKAVKQISEIERAMLVLYIEGFSGKEIASQIGISEGAVRVKLSRIKKKLISIIKEMNHEF